MATAPALGWDDAPGASLPPAPREWLTVFGLVALAAGLRHVAWLRVAAIFDDGPIFVAIARAFADGDWWLALSHPYHPLYPMAMAAVSPLTSGLEDAAGLVSVASGALAVAALYFFVRRAFEPRVAVIAALLLCIHPLAVGIDSDVQADGLYLACFMAALALLWRSLERSRGGRHRARGPRVASALAAGVATGLAYLTRPEGLVIAPLGVLAPWVVQWGRGDLVRRALPASAAFAVGLSCFAAPYVGVMHEHTGVWTLSQKPSVMRIFAAAAGDPGAAARQIAAIDRAVKQSRALPVPSVPVSRRKPPDGVAERISRVLSEVWQAVIPALRIELAGYLAIGLWIARGSPTRRGWMLSVVVLLHVVMSLLLADTAGYVSRRHVLPGVVPLFGVVALGVLGLASAAAHALRGHAASGRLRLALTAVTLSVLAAAYAPRLLEERRADRLAVREAAQWVRAQHDVPGGVAGRRMRVAYYGGRPFVELPPDLQAERLGSFLRRRDAAFVVVDEQRRSEVAGLRNPRAAGLVPVHYSEARGRVAVVYRVAPQPRRPPSG